MKQARACAKIQIMTVVNDGERDKKETPEDSLTADWMVDVAGRGPGPELGLRSKL